MYSDDDLLPLSALQHLLFCERQCALIHVEQIWQENVYTIEGQLLHKRAHSGSPEKRPGKRTEFGMPIRSLELGLVGKTDVAEYDGKKTARIVEYKRGRPKKGREDEIQLCAQGLCIEEMTGIPIPEGSLFYGKIKRRKVVAFTDELRMLTVQSAVKLHTLVDEGITPPPISDPSKCPRCSLRSVCLPDKLSRRRSRSVYFYYSRMIRSGDAAGSSE